MCKVSGKTKGILKQSGCVIDTLQEGVEIVILEEDETFLESITEAEHLGGGAGREGLKQRIQEMREILDS